MYFYGNALAINHDDEFQDEYFVPETSIKDRDK